MTRREGVCEEGGWNGEGGWGMHKLITLSPCSCWTGLRSGCCGSNTRGSSDRKQRRKRKRREVGVWASDTD